MISKKNANAQRLRGIIIQITKDGDDPISHLLHQIYLPSINTPSATHQLTSHIWKHVSGQRPTYNISPT